MADSNELTTEVLPGGDAAAKKELRRTILRKLTGRDVPTFVEQLRGPDGKPRMLVVERLPRTADVSDEKAASFVRDARAASALQHPNIVKTRAISIRQDEIVLACDYVEGERLSELMRTLAAAGSTLPTDVAVRIFIDLLSGLEALHGFSDPKSPTVKLAHGELTAANVLVGGDGVSRLLHTARIRRPTQVASAEGSIAPEVVAGAPADRRADIFGVGVLLWQVLSGIAALADAAYPDLIAKIRAGRVDRAAAPKDAPWAAPLVGVAARAMAIAPADRYPSAAAMSEELQKIASSNTAKPSQVAALVQTKAGEKIAARRKLAERALHPSSSETKAAAPVAPAPPPAAAAPVAPAPPPARGAEAPKSPVPKAPPASPDPAPAKSEPLAGQPIRAVGTPAKTPPEGAKPASAAQAPAPAPAHPKPPTAPAAPKAPPAATAAQPAPAAPKAPAPAAAAPKAPAPAPAPKAPVPATAPKAPAPATAPKPPAPAAAAPKAPAPAPAPKAPAPATAAPKGPTPPSAPKPPAATAAKPPAIATGPKPATAVVPKAPAAPRAPEANAKAPMAPIVKTSLPNTVVASASPKAPPAAAAKPAVEPKAPVAATVLPIVPKAPAAPLIDAMGDDPVTQKLSPFAFTKPAFQPLHKAEPPPPAKSHVLEIDGAEADSVPPSEPPSDDGDRPTFPRYDPPLPTGLTPPVTERPVPAEPKVVIASGRRDDGEEIDLTDSGPPSSSGVPNLDASRLPGTVPAIRKAPSPARPRFDTPTAAPVTATAAVGASAPFGRDGSEETEKIVVPVSRARRSRIIVAAITAACLVIGAIAFRALQAEPPAASSPAETKPPTENAAKPVPLPKTDDPGKSPTGAPTGNRAVAPGATTAAPAMTGAAAAATATEQARPAQAEPPPQDEPAAQDPAALRPAPIGNAEPPLFEPPARTPSGPSPPGQPSLRGPRPSNPDSPSVAPPPPRPKFDPKRI